VRQLAAALDCGGLPPQIVTPRIADGEEKRPAGAPESSAAAAAHH